MLLRVFLAGAWLALLVTPAAAQVRGGLPEWDGTPDPVALRALEEGRRDEVDRALRGRQWERAARLLVTEIERGPASPELLKLLAGVFMRDRKPLNAAIAIKKAEALGPLDHGTRFQLALAYIAMHRGDWARPELQQLAAAEPANALYAYWLGRIDYDAGLYESAVRHFEDVVARQPSFMRAYDNLGLCYEALNQPETAIAKYRMAIRLNRDTEEHSPWPPLNLGILLRTRGDLAEADALFREALSYDAQFAPAHYQRGTLLEHAGRVEEAIAALRRAADLDDSYAEPHYALARIYRRQGRRAEADAALVAFKHLQDARRPGQP